MQCRIAITTECNLNCKYCCMKDPTVFSSFRECVDIKDIPDLHKYESFAITGGEPLTDPILTVLIADALKNYPGKKFLYTNGTLADENFLPLIARAYDGINIGLHPETKKLKQSEILNINSYIPVRLLICEDSANTEFFEFVKKYNIAYRLWKINDCENQNEDRFILS